MAVQLQPFLHRDRPGPDRHEGQNAHDDLHHDVGLHEEIDDGQLFSRARQFDSNAFHGILPSKLGDRPSSELQAARQAAPASFCPKRPSRGDTAI
jgi:hypothetical protein